MEVASGDFGDYIDVLEQAAQETKWKYVPTSKYFLNIYYIIFMLQPVPKTIAKIKLYFFGLSQLRI